MTVAASDEDYQISEIQRGATPNEVMRARLKQMRRWHSDTAPPGQEELYARILKAVNQAYQDILYPQKLKTKAEEERDAKRMREYWEWMDWKRTDP